MKKRCVVFSLGIVILLAAIFALQFGANNAYAQPQVNWKFQNAYTPPEKVLGYFGVFGQGAELCRRIKARTNGMFDIKQFVPGSIGISSMEALNAVRKGAVDMAAGGGIYATGLVPEARIQHIGLPYAATKPEEGTRLMLHTDFQKVLGQAYLERMNGILIGLTSACACNYMTTFPVTSLESLKGKKIRASGGLAAVVTAQGGTQVSIAPAELYLALQTGTIDGVIFPPYAGVSYKIFEVAKYVSMPPNTSYTAMDWVVNKDSFNKLPKEYQKILQEEMDKLSRESYEIWGPSMDKTAQEEGEKKYGVKYVQLSDQEFAKLRKAVEPVWDDMAKISAHGAKLVQIIKTELKLK